MNQGDEHKTLGRTGAWEMILMALTAYYEAADQGAQGMLAVCWVIRNRVLKAGKTWWGDDWEDVVLKKWQFTAMTERFSGKAEKVVLPGDPSKDTAWASALAVAEHTYLGMGIDPTNGATHYYAPKLVAAPAWVTAPGTVKTAEIGDHIFFKAN